VALLSVLLAVVFAGCTAPTNGNLAEKPTNADKASDDDIATLAQGSNEFSLELLRALDEKDNLFLSPLSVAASLSLAFANNEGAPLARPLHVSFTQEELNTAFAGLIWRAQGRARARPYQLYLANAVWLTTSKDFTPFPEYVKAARDNYAAPPHSVDFNGQGVERINTWCFEKTNGKIGRVLERRDVNPDTVAVLTSAIYFKGNWTHQFEGDATRGGTFHVGPGLEGRAAMMHQSSRLPYHESDEAQVLGLPYEGDHLSMIVVLPKARYGLAKVEAGLSAKQLKQWAEDMEKQKVEVALPRFRMGGKRFLLKEKLKAMGLPMKTEPNIGLPPPGLFLEITEVFHSARVEVNEKGSEAAAVASSRSDKKDGPPRARPAGPVTFIADHPFLFLIRDNQTGCILFLGRVVDPS
jgi:serpin B